MTEEGGALNGVPEWALRELREARVGHLATAGSEGRPLVVPVCFVFQAAVIYTAIDAKPKTTRRLRRVRDIEENPWVALVVDRYDEDWRRLWWVLVRGRAEQVEKQETRTGALDALEEKYSQYRRLRLDARAPVIEIRIRRVTAWRFED